MAQAVLFDIFDGGRNRLLDIETVEETRVDHRSGFGVEALLADIAAFDQRNDREVELLRERIVTAVVSRHGHDGSCTITCEDIFRNPDRDSLARERVDTVGTAEHSGDGPGLGDTLALGLLADCGDIFIDSGLLLRCREDVDEIALGSKDHEGHSEHRVRAGCEYGDVVAGVTVPALEDNFTAE